MTIVAAYKCPTTKEYWIASDSDGIGQNEKNNYGSKLLKHNNYAFGFSDSYLPVQILEEEDLIPKDINNFNDLKDFRNLTQLSLEEHHVRYDDKDLFPTHPVLFLFITKLGIYFLGNMYELLKCKDGYAAIGAGSDYATGSLFNSMKRKDTGKDAVSMAVQAAKRHSTYCGGRTYFAAINNKGKFIR